MLEGDEKLLHGILDMLTNISISYLNKQIEAGIDVAMIFDTWGSLLNDEQYEKFSLRYINKIKHSISNQDIPLIYYVRETDKKLEALKSLNIDVLGIDSTTEIGVIKKQIGDKFALQGNLDVNILKKDEKDIIIEIKKILTSYGSNSGHVFNLGTGITPDINPDKVKILIDNLADISSKINVK